MESEPLFYFSFFYTKFQWWFIKAGKRPRVLSCKKLRNCAAPLWDWKCCWVFLACLFYLGNSGKLEGSLGSIVSFVSEELNPTWNLAGTKRGSPCGKTPIITRNFFQVFQVYFLNNWIFCNASITSKLWRDWPLFWPPERWKLKDKRKRRVLVIHAVTAAYSIHESHGFGHSAPLGGRLLEQKAHLKEFMLILKEQTTTKEPNQEKKRQLRPISATKYSPSLTPVHLILRYTFLTPSIQLKRERPH